MARKMWMGPRGRERWVPAPQSGMETTPTGFVSQSSMLNGGAGIRASDSSHQEYSPSWNPSGRDELRPIEDMAKGMYGRGLIYFIDPMAADKNVLPYQWSVPSLAASDGPVLWGDRRPAVVSTAANSLDYPDSSAQYTATPSGRMRRTYAWTGTANASNSTETFDGAVVRTNYATNPAPAGSSMGVVSLNNGVPTLVDDAASPSGRSYKVADSGSTDYTGFGISATPSSITAGSTWWARARCRLDASVYGYRRLYLNHQFLNASGVLLQSTDSGAVDLIPEGTFRRWTGAANASTSEEYTGMTRRVNLEVNPGLRTGVLPTGWAGSGNWSASSGAIGTGAAPDMGSAVFTRTSATAGNGYATRSWVGLTVGATYALSYSVKFSQAGQYVEGVINTDFSASLGQSNLFVTTANAYQQVTRTFVAQQTSAMLILNDDPQGAPTSGQTVIFSKIKLEQATSAGTYFDGSAVTPVTGKYRAWVGAANASPSIEASPDGTQRFNLLPNPAFQNGVSGYATEPSISATRQVDGSMRVLTKDGQGQSFVISNVANNTDYTLVMVARSFQGGQVAVYGGTPQGVQPGLAADYATYYLDLTTATQGNLYLAVISAGNNPGNGFDLRSLMLVPGKGYRGAYFDGSTVDSSLRLPTGTVSGEFDIIGSAVAPANATRVVAGFIRDQRGAALKGVNDTFYARSLLLSQDGSTTAPSYFDGSTAANTPADSIPPVTRSSVYVPIPPGHTAWVGLHGSADGSGGLEVTPVTGPDSTAAPVLVAPLPVSSDVRVDTAFSGDQYRGIDIRFGGGTSTTVTVAGVMVQILKSTATPQTGGFISGQGHSGCRFNDKPRKQSISAAIGRDGLVSLTAKLVEVGDWI